MFFKFSISKSFVKLSSINSFIPLAFLLLVNILSSSCFFLVYDNFFKRFEYCFIQYFVLSSISKSNIVEKRIALNILRASSFRRYLGLPTVVIIFLSKSSLAFNKSIILPSLSIQIVLIVKSLLYKSCFKFFIYFNFTGTLLS